MAGHSKFKNIMHRKGAQDKKRAKIFTKIIREITVAVKLGSSDYDSNPRLRSAIAEAKEVNMPKDNIDRAIKKGSGAEAGDNWENIRYEGYGVGGVAFIVEALSDNRNRTGPEVRATFAKNGGSLGADNSVAFMFERLGIIKYKINKLSFDKMFEVAIEAEALDILQEESSFIIETKPEDVHLVAGNIISQIKEEPSAISIEYKPKIEIQIDNEDQAKSILKLIDALEDLDDVQKVFANFDISEELLEKLG